MTDAISIVVIFAVWILITKFLFPKMGVPT